MADVRYEAPRTVSDAVKVAATSGARFIAGGTDLLVQIRNGAAQPAVYVDIKRIPELIGVKLDASGVRIGAATPAALVCENADVRSCGPVCWTAPASSARRRFRGAVRLAAISATVLPLRIRCAA